MKEPSTYRRTMKKRIAYTFLCWVVSSQIALTQTEKPVASTTTSTMNVSWSEISSIALDGRRAVLIGFPACSAGEIFFLAIDDFQKGDFVLHSLDKSGKGKTYRALAVPGFTAISPPTRFSAGPSYVAELTSGQRTVRDSNPDQDAESVPLVVVFHRDGSFAGAFSPPENLTIKAIGVFEGTGHVLILGTSGEDKRASLKIYDLEGSETGSFALWDNDPNSAPNARAKQPLGDIVAGGALEFAQIASAGENLLLIPTLSSQPVLWLNEHGVTRTTTIRLPVGSNLQTILDPTAIPWLVKTFASVKRDPPIMVPGPILAINPFDGTVQSTILSSDKKHSIACEQDGVFLGLTTNSETGVMQVSTGTIQR